MHGARHHVQRLLAVREQAHGARPLSSSLSVSVDERTEGVTRTACSIDSMPHRPQPTGPAIWRRRAVSASFCTWQPDLHVDAPVLRHHLDGFDLAWITDDAFRQAEADARSPRDRRASPSSRHGSSRDRRRRPGFPPAQNARHPQAARCGGRSRRPPPPSAVVVEKSGMRDPTQPPPACQRSGGTGAPVRHTRSASRLGPFDGEICTAVTLYSGQFVAQSEKSVVMTFACVVGWWKVV
jgi:hypothetical protein